MLIALVMGKHFLAKRKAQHLTPNPMWTIQLVPQRNVAVCYLSRLLIYKEIPQGTECLGERKTTIWPFEQNQRCPCNCYTNPSFALTFWCQQAYNTGRKPVFEIASLEAKMSHCAINSCRLPCTEGLTFDRHKTTLISDDCKALSSKMSAESALEPYFFIISLFSGNNQLILRNNKKINVFCFLRTQ